MKKCLIVLFLLAANIPVRAQDSLEKKSNYITSIGLTIGYGNMDISELHAFVPAGVNDFRDEQFLFGLDFHGFKNKLALGFSVTGILDNKIKTDSINYTSTGSTVTFDMGYLFLEKQKVKSYALVGIGFGGSNIHIGQNNSIPIDSIIKNPGREINISNASFVIDASLNLNFSPNMKYREKRNGYSGFMTGLKVGYLYGIPNSDWVYSGGDIANGPDFGMNMFYVKFFVGILGYKDAK